MHPKIQHEIDLLNKLDEAIEKAKDIIGDDSFTMFLGCEIGVSKPYNFDLIKKNTVEFEKIGFKKTWERMHTDDGTLQQNWRYGEAEIIVYYRSYREGSTCRRVKIGEETVVKPIYEIVCPEA